MAKSFCLVGDIGGTHARFAVADHKGGLTDIVHLKVKDFGTAEDALDHYLRGLAERPQELCLASAGKRTGDRIELTNAHWSLSESGLRSRFGFAKAKLINDFEALAHGVQAMTREHLLEVKKGDPAPGSPLVCLGPGTGFGQAIILPGSPARVIATEGGFRLLPVRTERDRALYLQLEKAQGRPPILEEVLSGRGLVHLYFALGGSDTSITPAHVTQLALVEPGCERDAVHWFFEHLASAASDACLMTGAWGGVIIGGGVVPRLTSLLDREAFAATFARSGSMQGQLDRVPVHLITDSNAALLGASVVARTW